MSILYFEDFQVGDTFDLGSLTVTQKDIIAFARQFDPQPFHSDPELAKDSIFEGLVASGWHTTAMFMRLLVDGLLNKTISIASPGVQDVRWLKPVRPDNVLRANFTVLECISSKSRPNLGIVLSSCEVINQENELVMSLHGTHFFGRRPQSSTQTG